MNILFVNYGDFTTNSLNHISGFANALSVAGHSCVVAINGDLKTLANVPNPLFAPATYEALLAKPAFFPDQRPADIVHAWTPRECVRKFLLAYQPKAHAKLVVHLEDNEEFLSARWLGQPVESLQDLGEVDIRQRLTSALSHPRRYPHLLRAADGVTVIVEPLKKFAPQGIPSLVLPPGVDFGFYRPQAADATLRKELGLQDDEKVIVYTGSNTFANESEIRDLYLAVALLNARGTRTRLIRTGFNSPDFEASLPQQVRSYRKDLGFVEKARLPRLLALADVLVQPGRAGAFNDFRLPSKLPEYLSVGRPVVLPATNIGHELRDGVDALLLQTGSPEEIADACQRVFADPNSAKKLSENAVAFAHRRFDLQANTRTLADFYGELLRAPKRPGSTAQMAAGETELSLSLNRLAATTTNREAADVANELAPLVAALDSDEAAHAERTRLEHELAEWRSAAETAKQHAGVLEERQRLTEQHASGLEEKQRLTEQHAGNLTKELTDARGRLQRLEGKYAISEKLLSSARRQLESIDRDLAAARRQVTQLEEVNSLTTQHAKNLENLRDSLQRRVRELDQQCGHLERTIKRLEGELDHRDAVIAQREAKIRTIEESFSWQVTKPLRWLRRKFVDPRRPRPKDVTAAAEARPVTLPPEPPPAAVETNGHSTPANGAVAEAPVVPTSPPALPIVQSVDYPQSWSLSPRKVVMRGWCFAEDGRKLTAIRAILPDRTIEGAYGFKRLDVLAAVRGRPDAEYCGWKFDIEFVPADTQLDLEVRDEQGNWHRFFHTGLRIGEGFGPLDLTSYEQWIDVYDRQSTDHLLDQNTRAGKFIHQPRISILVPVYNTPEAWLRRAVESVRSQSYPHWELCLSDDASPAPHIRTLLDSFAASDQRIKVVFRAKNGHISAASNSALEIATGDFIALLDHDDELAPNALFEVVAAINARPDADYLYSDEDKIDEDGRRFEPYFKPDWQPDLFLGQNYTSHLSVYRTALVRSVGGFRIGYEGSQDWDLALRVVEQTTPAHIVHIPKILYHWRAIPGSTALQLAEKNYPVDAARRALVDHFARIGEPAELVPVPGDHWRVKRPIPSPAPRVALIIPTRNGLTLLRRCIESILEKTSYSNYEILIVDNDSDDPATVEYLRSFEAGAAAGTDKHVRVLHAPGPFNYSSINNAAVKQTSAAIVGLLNNDLEVINGDWLEEMVSHAIRPHIGCVGAMLYYPNDTIQHAGVVLGVGGVAGHAFREFPRGTEGKFNRARLVQNYSSVTAACLIVRKAIYEEVGGLDEQTLAVAFNDIDFCLKVRSAGYTNLWTPFAELYHHESASRGADDTPDKANRFQAEVETMLRRWGPLLQRDPAYNPNLTLELNDFSLASPPRPALIGSSN